MYGCIHGWRPSRSPVLGQRSLEARLGVLRLAAARKPPMYFRTDRIFTQYGSLLFFSSSLVLTYLGEFHFLLPLPYGYPGLLRCSDHCGANIL